MKRMIFVCLIVLFSCSSAQVASLPGGISLYGDGTAKDETGKLYLYFQKDERGQYVCHKLAWKIEGRKLFIGVLYYGDDKIYYMGKTIEGIKDGEYYDDQRYDPAGWVNWYSIDDIRKILKNN